ncbi:hypothetical protein [Metabacillus sp. FJAT-53654]|uniref:Uncharacterized protein n=1 Tax=Metabacillus rhizosphaerae TaxID=3117747 RepID=A0ABZ2MWJ9_9BACI
MGTTSGNAGRVTVIFHHDEHSIKKIHNLAELTALLGSDLIFIDEFKEPKKLDKKVWKSHVNGMSLEVYLK